MKLTFKVCKPLRSYPRSHADCPAQDLKQQKFVIEAEPSETVRHPASPAALPNNPETVD